MLYKRIMMLNFKEWLNPHIKSAYEMTPLAGDASFRSYFRIRTPQTTLIAVDASAEREKCAQFIAIANGLRCENVLTPDILANDLTNGFLLLCDFGDDQYLKILTPQNAKILYEDALHTLLKISQCQSIADYSLPLFTETFMREELNSFQEWFLEKYLGLNLSPALQAILSKSFDLIAKASADQPYVFMHRDYHSANLMRFSGRVGVLDFQDAFRGPITYDLVSLLRDCYIDWPQEWITQLVLNYRQEANVNVSDATFLCWFDWMGLQRHMKALLTFSRKFHRDNNSNYLIHIPRTLNYIIHATEHYSEFTELHQFFKDTVMEKVTCAQ